MAENDTIRVQLNYPPSRVVEPVVYHLIKDYGLVPNLRRANFDDRTGGFLFLELTGARDRLEDALHWLDSLGISVNPIGLDGTQEWAV